MKTQMFKTAAGMIEEIQRMEKTEERRRRNRAMVSKFYNGAPPYSDAEAAAAGLQMNVNNLFGYTALAQAKGRLMAIYNKPPQFFEVKLRNAPAGEKQRWEMKATEIFNRIVKRSDRFKMSYDGVAGDCIMHGEGIPLMHTTTDWCPKHFDLASRLIPDEAQASAQTLSHFAVLGGLSFDDVLHHLRHKSEGWNLAMLKAAALKMCEGEKSRSPERFPQDFKFNPEAEEYARQAGVDFSGSDKLPVYYFYQVRGDKPGRPVDLTILARERVDGTSTSSREDMEDRVLYRGECRYPHISKLITPVFMGCRLGGTALWHRNLGLGHLNYDIAWHVEAMMCRMMQASIEDATMFWKVSDSSAREALQAIRLKHNGIIPDGADPVPRQHASNLQGLLSVMQTLRQQGANNAFGLGGNQGTEADMLEVQALAQKDDALNARSEHTANWFEHYGRIGNESFSRFTNPFITHHDAGWSEISEFQAAMEAAGLPLKYLQPENVTVTVARIAGDGNQQQATAQGVFLLNNIQHVDPKAQPTAKRHAFAAILGDYALAASFISVESDMPSSQRREAEQEDAAMFKRGSIGQLEPLDTTAADVHEEHIPAHFETMAALIAKGVQSKNTWTPEQLASFQLIAAHTYLHIRALEQMAKKEPAKQAMDVLNRFSAMGQKMANNLAQKGGEQEFNPLDVAKLQLEERKISLQEHKADFGESKFERTQSLRERQAATTELVTLQRDNREAAAHSQDLALSTVKALTDLQPQNA